MKLHKRLFQDVGMNTIEFPPNRPPYSSPRALKKYLNSLQQNCGNIYIQLVMEQTLVKQFFPTVKKTLPTHPAKRRKLSSTGIDQTIANQQRKNTTAVRASTRAGRAKKVVDLPLSQLLTAVPVSMSSQATSNKDEHSELRRKVPQTKQATKKTSVVVEKKVTSITSSSKSREKTCRGEMKIDPWITEQAKLVLRNGHKIEAAVKSEKKDAVHEKLPTRSEILIQNSKEVFMNKGNVREDLAKKYHENNKKLETNKRSRLRQKFAHLLVPDDKKSLTTASIPEKNVSNDEHSNLQKAAKVPAHQKYKALTTEKPTEAFTLPQKYKRLLEIFRCVDSVIFLLHRRSEVCTFDRLKKSVQSMLGRKFTESQLSQLKTVYPKGFTFRVEKNLRDLNGIPSGPQLTVYANFEDTTGNYTAKKDVSQTVLIMRRKIFESSLIEITKAHHQKFLQKLNLEVADSDLHRWHPHFKLEEVPDIKESTLPRVTVAKAFTSAKDILEKARGIPQVDKALENVAKSTREEGRLKMENNLPTKTNNNTNTCSTSKRDILKGVSNSIVDRIRQKELKKAELEMLRNPEQERRLALMDHLPDFVRILKTYFTTERKAAITMEDCVAKLMESFGTVSSTEKIEEHIILLKELVPDWLQVVNVRKSQYVKLAKNADINVVLSKLETIRKDESKR